MPIDRKEIVTKSIVNAVGATLFVVAIKTFDKKLASAFTVKSAAVLIVSYTLLDLGLDTMEKNNYFGL